MKGKFAQPSKVSKYYKDDCLQNFLLFFVAFLTASIVKNSHAGIYFIFLKKVQDQT